MGCSASKSMRSPSRSPEVTPAKKQQMKDASTKLGATGPTADAKETSPKLANTAPEHNERHTEEAKAVPIDLEETTPKSAPAPARTAAEPVHRASPAQTMHQETSPKPAPALPVTEHNHRVSMPRSEPKETTPKSAPAPARTAAEPVHRASPAQTMHQETSPKPAPALPVTEHNHRVSMPRSEPKETTPKPAPARAAVRALPHNRETTQHEECSNVAVSTHPYSGASPPLRRSPYAARPTADGQLLRAARATQARKSASPQAQAPPVTQARQAATDKTAASPATQASKSHLSGTAAPRGARTSNGAPPKEEAQAKTSTLHPAPKHVAREGSSKTEVRARDQNTHPGTRAPAATSTAVKAEKHGIQPRREAMLTMQSNVAHPVAPLHLPLDYAKDAAAASTASTAPRGSGNGIFVSTSIEKRLRTEPEEIREVSVAPVAPDGMVVENVKNDWVVVRSVPTAGGWQLLRQIQTLVHLVGTLPT